MTDTLLTIDEAADRLNRSAETLRYWRKVGSGPRMFRLGRRLVVAERDLNAWLAEQREQQGLPA